MFNEMLSARPIRMELTRPVDLYGINELLLVFELADYPFLINPVLVQSCMDEFLVRYPKITDWDARANEGRLFIKVRGTINPSAIVHYGL